MTIRFISRMLHVFQFFFFFIFVCFSFSDNNSFFYIHQVLSENSSLTVLSWTSNPRGRNRTTESPSCASCPRVRIRPFRSRLWRRLKKWVSLQSVGFKRERQEEIKKDRKGKGSLFPRILIYMCMQYFPIIFCVNWILYFV